MTSQHSPRRDFLKATAIAAGAAFTPYSFWNRQTLADEAKSPNGRFNMGVIGCGGMANGNINTAREWLNVVAVADVDEGRRNEFSERFSGGKADTFNDYRSVIERDDVDVIHIATPDHWHTKPLVEAMLAGKDVYCEKPLTLTIDEGKLIRKVQKETGRVVQVGTQQRSTFHLFVKAMAIVAEGRLGKIKRMEASIGGGPTSEPLPVVDVPAGLDWDRWLGPAPKADYRLLLKDGQGRPQTNCHYEFRWWYEYSGGKLTDWGAHHVDIAAWALRLNGQDPTPLSVGGTAEHPVEYKDGYPVQNDRYNTATKFALVAKLPGDVELLIKNKDNGVLIEGEKGRIFVNRGRLTGSPVEDLESNPLSEDTIQKVYKGLPMEHNERKAHWANFLHCVKTRDEPISDVHTHMEMLNICHLAGISARLGREVQWDGVTEQIVGDEQANSFVAREYRKGYEIEMG
jgi:predicted dehydrogenase